MLAISVPTERSCVPVMMVAMRQDTAPDPVSTKRSGRGTKYLRQLHLLESCRLIPAYISGITDKP